MTFDIASEIDVSDTFDFELKHPKTGLPVLGEGGQVCSITVLGPKTRQYAAAKARDNARMVDNLARDAKPEEEGDDVRQAVAAFLAPCTVRFNNFSYKNMEPGEATFRAFYLDPNFGWAAERLNREIANWGNFTKGSSTTS